MYASVVDFEAHSDLCTLYVRVCSHFMFYLFVSNLHFSSLILSVTLSCSHWDKTTHCCGDFLRGHGLLCSLLEMIVGLDWKGLDGYGLGMDSFLWSYVNPCWRGYFSVTDKPCWLCGSLWRSSQCCPLLMSTELFPECELHAEGSRREYSLQWGEPAGSCHPVVG